MAIERIRFQTCDACGQRFRDAGRQISYAKMLCKECREKAKRRGLEAEMALEGTEDELLPEELDIELLEVVPGEETVAERAAGPTLDEIAARTPRRRRRRRSTAGLERLRWPIYAGCLLVAIGIGVAGLWRARVKGRHVRSPAGGDSPFGDVPVLPVEGLPDYEKSRDLARRFVREGEVEEVMKMIRPWPGMKQAVDGFLAENPPVDGAAEMLSDMPPIIQADIVYQSFGLLLPDGTGRLVQVIKTSDGPRVDFKAYVEWCSAPRDELVAGTVEQADEVRAILRPSTYYNFEFASAERFLAFSATLAGEKEPLTVYVPRDSPAAETLVRAVRQVGMHPATFSLRAVGESHKRQQYLLTDLKATGFVVPEQQAAK